MTTTSDRIKCPHCDGKRIIVRREAERRYAGGLEYYTGKEVDRLYECRACHGRGKVTAPAHPLMPAIGTNA